MKNPKKKYAFIQYHRTGQWTRIPLWKAKDLISEHRRRRTLKILANVRFLEWGRVYELNKFYPEDKLMVMRTSW